MFKLAIGPMRSAVQIGLACLLLGGVAGCERSASAPASEAENRKAPQGVSAQPGSKVAVSDAGSTPSDCAAAPELRALDFWGVELGMTEAKVAEIIKCLGTDFQLQTSQVVLSADGSGFPNVPHYLVTRGEFGGQEELNISFAGKSTAERVVRLTKVINWPSGSYGSRREIEAAMASMYGPFERVDEQVYTQNTYGQIHGAGEGLIRRVDGLLGVCSGLAISTLKTFNGFLAKYDPSPEKCGRVLAFNVQAESNVSDNLGRMTLGTYEFGAVTAAVAEALRQQPAE